MKNLNDKKKLLVLFGIGSIILLTLAVSYAFFSYSRTGTTENTIASGSIKFHYNEDSQGISITDGMPISDNDGKESNYFEFTIESKTSETVDIPYYITARRSGTGVDMDNAVKLYLTKVDGYNETPVNIVSGKNIATFSELGTYTNSDGINIPNTEKLLYRETVFAGTTNYSQKYRLRMWLNNNSNDGTVAEYSQTVTGVCSNNTYTTRETCVGAHEDWTDTAINDSKTYIIKVNVYGSGVVADQSTIDFRASTNITEIELGNNVITSSTKTFEDTATIPVGETSITKQIIVNTTNPNATVIVDNITPTGQVIKETGIKRLALTQNVTIKLGINNFRITVRSEDKKETEIYNLNITGSYPSYEVTFDKQSGTGGTNSTTVTYGDNMPSITLPTRNGYTFDGYYDATSGTGTKYYNADGTSARTYTATTGKTLYAKWVPKSYTVTLIGNHVAFDNSSITVSYGSSSSVKTTPSQGYYITSISCTNGYTGYGNDCPNCTTTGNTIINNNNVDDSSTCTIVASTVCGTGGTIAGSGNIYGKYNAAGQLTQCYYGNPSSGGTLCTANKANPNIICTTFRFSAGTNLYYQCNSSLGHNYITTGGNLPSGFSCP